MSKKFRKLLFLSAAVASATAAVCYFVRKREIEQDEPEEDDYDDFSDDEENDSDHSRSYVPLNSDAGEAPAAKEDSAEKNVSEEPAGSAVADTPAAEAAAPEKEASSFTPLAEQVAHAAGNAEESVEEFFDEEDCSEEEPPIQES